MRVILKSSGNIHNLMRQCGYFFERKDKEELVFVRIIGQSKSGYPRFHAYVKVDDASQQASINLHLDQKKPIYKGVPAHSAEYSGQALEKEAERIKQVSGL
jgi:hypothetical protein